MNRSLTFIICTLLIIFCNSAQAQDVIVTATEFNPNATNTISGQFEITNAIQTGVQPAELIPGLPWTGSTPLADFRKKYNYTITGNPANLNTVSTDFYASVPGDYMYIISPSPNSNANVLTYNLTDMVPNSDVTVTIKYQNIIKPTSSSIPTCKDRPAVLRYIFNPGQGQEFAGQEIPPRQMKPGEPPVITDLKGKADANGNLVFKLNQVSNNECGDLGISSIVIKGQIKPAITSRSGDEVCRGEQIILEPKFQYKGTYQWLKDGQPVPGATNSSFAAIADLEKSYAFKLQIKLEGTNNVLTTNEITVKAIKCCEGPNNSSASRQTVFLDDFGRLDMTDPSNTRFMVWDYLTEPSNPKEKVETGPTRYRRKLNGIEPGTFDGEGSLLDGFYTVAANITKANMDWSNNIGGLADDGQTKYDHSGKIDGAALFINVDIQSSGNAIYTREIPITCAAIGSTVFFECYINCFTNGNPPVVGYKLESGSNSATGEATTRGALGKWVKISGSVVLNAPLLKLTLYNNAPKFEPGTTNFYNEKGNDLVIDDIKVLACAPPPIDLVFDVPTLSRAESVCLNMNLNALPTENLKKYYGTPTYIYQWTTTPADNASWKTIDGVEPNTTKLVAFPAKLKSPDFVNGNKIFFRVVAAAAAATLTAPGAVFNKLNPCRNYSVSDPVEATIDCPTCVTPTSLKVENGAATIANNGVVTVCEGTATSLKLTGAWPTPPAALSDKNFEFYVISKTTNTEVWKSTPPVNGGTGGSATYTIPAAAVIPALSGDYIIGVRNTVTCKLEQTITINVNAAIKNNAITADQTICSGDAVAALIQDAGKIFSGDLATPGYQWQSSTVSAVTGFTDVAGTAASFTPAGLTATTYFRRIAKARGGFCPDSISKAVKITVDQPITSAQNAVSTSTPVICSGNPPAVTGLAITSATYVWEQAEAGSGPWTAVSGGITKDLPSVVLNNTIAGTTKSYYFHRTAKVGKCTHTSAPVEVKVSGGMTAGEVTADSLVCKDGTTVPSKITSILPATGGSTSPVLYEWEVSDDGVNGWTSLGARSAASTEYAPATAPAKDQYYRRKAYAGTGLCDNATSKTIKIAVVTPPVATILSPVSVISPASGSWTFNDPVLTISATPVSAGYTGTWTISPKGSLGSAAANAANTVTGMAFDDKSVLTWTVKDAKGKCPSAIATLNIERKNITVADAKDDSLCVTGLPYKLKGNGLITGEKSRWTFVSAIPAIAPVWSPRIDSSQLATITSVAIPANAGKVELIYRYTVKSPLLPDSSFKTVKIIIYESAQAAAVTGSPINTCASLVALTGNKPTQPTATGLWEISGGQGILEDKNLYNSNLTGLDNIGTTNLTWTITNHLCKAPSAPLIVNQKGKSTDARVSITGGSYAATEITNKTDVLLCKGIAYTLNAILPLTGLKGAEVGTWSSTSTATVSGSGFTVPLSSPAEGIADATWSIEPNISGCPPSLAKSTFKIGDIPLLDPVTGRDPVCEGDTANYKVSLTSAAGINILGASSYTWSSLINNPSPTGMATIQGPTSDRFSNIKFTSSSASLEKDQATISVTAANYCGTSAAQTKVITINLTPRIFSGDIKGDSLICETAAGSRTYNILNQANTTRHNWMLGNSAVTTGSLNATAATIPVSDITANAVNYKAILKIELINACGTGVSKDKVIDIIPAVPVKAVLTGAEKVCLPTDAVIYTGSTPNGGSGATFAFETVYADGTIGKVQSASTVATYPIVPGDLRDGDIIRLTVAGDPASGCFSGNGIPATLIIDGYVFPDTIVSRTINQPDSICTGNTIELCVKPTKRNPTYQWFRDGVAISNSANCISIRNSWESGNYKVTIDNEVCTVVSSYGRQVKIYDQPAVRIIPEDITIELAVNPSVILSGVVSNIGTDPLTQIEWNKDYTLYATDDTLIRIATPPFEGGDFYYTLTVATGEGRAYCPATAQAHVKALPPVKVPNAFSPNGDGLNDTWHIEGIDTYSRAKVYVYNRWGTSVFKAGPYGRGNEWDGKTNGGDLPTGTYYYVIELGEDTQFQKPKFEGSLTIIR